MYVEFNPEDFHNMLDDIKFDYYDLINMIKKLDYVAPPKVNKDPKFNSNEVNAVETWASYETHHGYVKMPKMVTAFYDFVLRYNRIPSQSEYVDEYFKYAKTNIAYKMNEVVRAGYDKTKFIEALDNRCRRSYPSFLRDLEFALLLKSKGMNVIYNETIDTDWNIDIMYISPNDNYYGIHCYTDTSRANEFRVRKDFRHTEAFANVINVDLAVNLGRNDRLEINNFKLYDDVDFKNLVENMKRAKKQFENQ